MTTLRLVGGTDVAEAEPPAVWDDPYGVERVLRGVLRDVDKAAGVVVVFGDKDGKIQAASSFESVELTMGLLHRGLHYLSEIAKDVANAQESET